MGPMTQQQTLVWQRALRQQAAQQMKPQAGILPGPIPLPILGPIVGDPKPVPVDPTDPGGPKYTPGPRLPVITIPPIFGLPITTIINICIPRVVVYPPGKEELCKQLQKDVDVAKKAAKGMSCNPEKQDSLAILQDKYDRNMAEAAARDKLNQTCFGGGDEGHKKAADQARSAARKCKDLM
jgi:Novel toxin 16